MSIPMFFSKVFIWMGLWEIEFLKCLCLLLGTNQINLKLIMNPHETIPEDPPSAIDDSASNLLIGMQLPDIG